MASFFYSSPAEPKPAGKPTTITTDEDAALILQARARGNNARAEVDALRRKALFLNILSRTEVRAALLMQKAYWRAKIIKENRAREAEDAAREAQARKLKDSEYAAKEEIRMKKIAERLKSTEHLYAIKIQRRYRQRAEDRIMEIKNLQLEHHVLPLAEVATFTDKKYSDFNRQEMMALTKGPLLKRVRNNPFATWCYQDKYCCVRYETISYWKGNDGEKIPDPSDKEILLKEIKDVRCTDNSKFEFRIDVEKQKASGVIKESYDMRALNSADYYMWVNNLSKIVAPMPHQHNIKVN